MSADGSLKLGIAVGALEERMRSLSEKIAALKQEVWFKQGEVQRLTAEHVGLSERYSQLWKGARSTDEDK